LDGLQKGEHPTYIDFNKHYEVSAPLEGASEQEWAVRVIYPDASSLFMLYIPSIHIE